MSPETIVANQLDIQSCPSRSRLSAFCTGDFDEAALSTIATHVQSCDHCQTMLNEIESNDDFYRCFRQADTVRIPDFADEPGFQRFVERARQVGREPESAAEFSGESNFEDSTRTSHGSATPIDESEIPAEIGRFHIHSVIGRGGFADVYLGEDPQRGRVAIKVARSDRLRQRDRDRFAEEAEKSIALKHPAIVPVHETGTDAHGNLFVVMDYMEGGSLDDVLRAGRPITSKQATNIVFRVAQALHYIHQRQAESTGGELIHRDVKPANILLDAKGQAYLADFGLAIADSERWSHSREMAGTLPYMSPEQVRGESEHLDGRTDIWSCGVVLYQLLVGRRPFTASHREQLVREIQDIDPKPPRQIDDTIRPQLEEVCLKCLSKTVGERYRSANELAVALRPSPYRLYALALPLLLVAALALAGVTSQAPTTQMYLEPIVSGRPGRGDTHCLDQRTGQITIKSAVSRGCFAIDRPLGNCYRFQTTAEFHQPYGLAGLIVGIHEIDDDPVQHQFWIVSVGNNYPTPGARLMIREVIAGADRVDGPPVILQRRMIASKEIEMAANRRFDIRVNVDDGRIVELQCNGAVFPDLVAELKGITLPRRSRVGVVALSHVDFHATSHEDRSQ